MMDAIVRPAVNRAILARRPEIVAALSDLLPGGRVIQDASGRQVYATGPHHEAHLAGPALAVSSLPLAVVLPATVRDVSNIMRFCFEEGIKVVPRGGGTSLTRGVAAGEDQIVLCLSRMNRVLSVNIEDRAVRVEAGITTAEVSAAVAHHGLFYAPDPSSRFASTIGGNIATNAAGAHALRYGSTSAHVKAIRVVFGDGEIAELGAGEEEASGYQLGGLILGSEAQLGIVVEATLRLQPKPDARLAIVLGFADIQAALAGAAALQAAAWGGPGVHQGILPQARHGSGRAAELAERGIGGDIAAVELFDRAAITASGDFPVADLPDGVGAILIMDIEGGRDELAGLAAVVADAAAPFGATVFPGLDTPAMVEAVWRAADSVLVALGRNGSVHCLDFAVPPHSLAEALATVGDIASSYQLGCANLCRPAEGIVRSVLYTEPGREDASFALALDDIGRMTVELRGILAAEHGIGAAKRRMMAQQLDPSAMNLHLRLKTAFDPEWLLNPGKVYTGVLDGVGPD